MLKDDRMMGMFTLLVVMVAIGTLIQRAEVFDRYFGDGKVAFELRQDEAIVRANNLSSIDVLANDIGIRDGDAERLIVLQQPKCGRAFVRDGAVQYLPREQCAGSQRFRYGISGRGDGTGAEIAVVVRLSEPTQSEVAADAQRDVTTPTPMAPRVSTPAATGEPTMLAAPPEAGAAGEAPTITALGVPRPQAPAITGLPEALSGEGFGVGSPSPGVSIGGTGSAPTITAPSADLGATTEVARVPAIPATEPEGPLAPDPAQLSVGGPAIDTAGDSGSEGAATAGLTDAGPAQPLPDDADVPLIQRETAGLDAGVPRISVPKLGAGDSEAAGLGQPGEVLATVRALGVAPDLAAVDTTAPAALGEPSAGDGQSPADSAAPALGVPPAAVPAPVIACSTPPTLILEVKPAGLTEVTVDSPCRANTVAELSYDGLRLALAIGASGSGTVAAIGFQQASDAVLRMADGETLEFNIPFADTERMDRVALVWEAPVVLELHAFEFGALPLGAGHVRPDQPRSFEEVRRGGGGYLLHYRPIAGIGQNVAVYTFWRRRNGPAGVVKLSVDFASRDGRERRDTCSGGAFAEPDFTILRSFTGHLLRPQLRRLTSLDCATIAENFDRYIADAVDDMIIVRR